MTACPCDDEAEPPVPGSDVWCQVGEREWGICGAMEAGDMGIACCDGGGIWLE